MSDEASLHLRRESRKNILARLLEVGVRREETDVWWTMYWECAEYVEKEKRRKE